MLAAPPDDVRTVVVPEAVCVRLPATEISPELATPAEPTVMLFEESESVPSVTVKSPSILRGDASSTNVSDALIVRLL